MSSFQQAVLKCTAQNGLVRLNCPVSVSILLFKNLPIVPVVLLSDAWCLQKPLSYVKRWQTLDSRPSWSCHECCHVNGAHASASCHETWCLHSLQQFHKESWQHAGQNAQQSVCIHCRKVLKKYNKINRDCRQFVDMVRKHDITINKLSACIAGKFWRSMTRWLTTSCPVKWCQQCQTHFRRSSEKVLWRDWRTV